MCSSPASQPRSAWILTATSNGSTIRRAKANGCSPRGRSTVPGFSPRPAGIARKEDRADAAEQRGRPALVPVLLLHGRANRDWARKHPLAAKRALRAILKGSRARASGPRSRVKAYLGQGYNANPEYARQALRDLPYGRWRDYNPEDTMRFYALRLREAGMVKSPPQKLDQSGNRLAALEQLKRESRRETCWGHQASGC